MKSKFRKYFKEIRVGMSDYGGHYSVSVEDVIEEFSADLETAGLYLLVTKTHAIYACCRPSEEFFIDTWDSRDQLVCMAYKVMHQCGKNSPYRLRYSEFVQIQRIFADKQRSDGWYDDKNVYRDLHIRFEKWENNNINDAKSWMYKGDGSVTEKGQDVMNKLKAANTDKKRLALMSELLNGTTGVKELACHDIRGWR